MKEKYIASIDLGSSKIALTVARIEGDDIQIVYYEETPSEGIRNSYVITPGTVEKKLKAAVAKAEEALHIKILQAVVNLPCYPVRQEIATAKLERNDGSGYIAQEEVDNLKEVAVDSYPLSDEKTQTFYGAVAQSFSTEDAMQENEENIVGMNSSFLEGNFKVFIGKRSYSENIDCIFNHLGIALAKKYFLPGILHLAVLKKEQKENGVALIDFGAGVTSVTLFKDNILRHYSAIPFGGKTITKDIKTECMISLRAAENIKKAYGGCMPDKLSALADKTLQIEEEENIRTRIPVKYLSEVITARVKEIMDAVLYEIQESRFADGLRSGVVLTGGGADLLNCANYLKEISGYNVSIGFPRNLFTCDGCPEVKAPSAAASVAMILAAKNDGMLSCTDRPPVIEREEAPEPAAVLPGNEKAEPDLIAPEEFGPEAEAPKTEKKKRQREPRPPKQGPGFGSIIWKKLGTLFDEISEEDV